MTVPTPEQMRALSNKMLATADWIRAELPDVAEELEDGLIALRAAADQLEAVQRIADSHRSDAETAACIVSVRLDAILPADTAPQEDRDD